MDFKRLVAFLPSRWQSLPAGNISSPAPNLIRHNKPLSSNSSKPPQPLPLKPHSPPATPITVTTDTVKAVIDEKSGDLRQMTLLKYKANGDEKQTLHPV